MSLGRSGKVFKTSERPDFVFAGHIPTIKWEQKISFLRSKPVLKVSILGQK